MGGVLKAAPIEQAAVEHIRAGGDLCLICHIEEYVTRSYEALIKDSGAQPQVCAASEQNPRRACWPSRKNHLRLKRRSPAPTAAKLEKLSRQVWEFGEAGAHGQAETSEPVHFRMIVAGIMSGTSADGINVALVSASCGRGRLARARPAQRTCHSNSWPTPNTRTRKQSAKLCWKP